MDPLFTVVVNTFNRADSLRRTLIGLSQLRWSNLEIVVVTGPSEDASREVVRQWEGLIKHVVCDVANLSVSRNLGLSSSSGDWIAFIDDDAIPEPNWIDSLAKHVNDQSCGALGGFVIDHTGRSYQAKFLVSDVFGYSELFEDEISLNSSISVDPKRKFLALMGVNSCFRREALVDVGGFDEAYAYFLDETDVIYRLMQKGWRTIVEPTALVHHKYADSHIRHQRVVTSLYHIMRSRQYFVLRHAAPISDFSEISRVSRRWLDELMDHQRANEQLNTGITTDVLRREAYMGLHDGALLADQRPSIVFLPESPPAPLRFKPILSNEKRLRLLLVSAMWPPHGLGGVARFIHVLAQSLVKDGHEVTVFTQVDSALPETVDYENGVWVHRIHALDRDRIVDLDFLQADVPPMLMKLGFAAAVSVELERWNSSRQFHAVLGSIWDLELSWILALEQLPCFSYLVTNYHELLQHKPEWHKSPFLNDWLEPMLEAEIWFLQHPDVHLIASTNAILEDAMAYAPSLSCKVCPVIPFGLHDAEFCPSVTVDFPRMNLLFVGRFESRKGVDVLLTIVPDLLSLFPELQITFVGDNSLPWPQGDDARPILTKFLETFDGDADRLHFLGEVNDERLIQLYAECDVFIAPSRYESFGLIYLEAMRAAKPCVGTRTGGIPEVVDHGSTGLLVQPGNPGELLEAVVFLLKNPAEADRMGNAGRKRFIEKFRSDIFVGRVVSEVLNKCLVPSD